MKRIISVILSVAMLLSITVGLSITVNADETIVDGDLEYRLLGEYDDNDNIVSIDCVEITKYNGSSPTLEIPETIAGYPVKKIGYGAFYGCSTLIDVKLPKEMVSIGGAAFYKCENLSSISLNDKIKEIGNSAFDNTAFYNDENNWNNGLLYVNDCLIEADSNIAGTVILNSDTVCIADYCFWHCSKLEEIIINEGIEAISSNCFEGCTNLNRITLPSTLKRVCGYYAFYDCEDLKNVNFLGTLSDWSQIDFSCFIDSENSEQIIGNPVYISGNLYINNELITNGIIENVTEIKPYTFYGLKSLNSITLCSSIQKIGISAFGKSGLRKVNYLGNINDWVSIDFFDSVFSSYNGANPITVAKSLYINDELVEEVKIENISDIKPYAFKNCESLKSITISNSVKSIGNEAFYGCYNLEKVNFNGTINDWVKISFGCYEDFGSINASANPLTITNSLYINDELITDLDLQGVDEIKSFSLYKCESIKSICADNSLKSVGACAFIGCKNLKSVKIPSEVKIDSYYGSFPGLSEINITEGSIEISEDFATLVKSSSVTEMTIPSSINYIPDSAFKDMKGLKAIIIPKSVNRIEYNAFSGCTNLTIKGYKGSYAETYANLLGIPFEALDDEEHSHSYTSSITKQPTCTSTGVKTYTCSCGDSYTVDILKSEHSYSTKTIKATTSNNGSITTSCDVCGDIKSSQVIYCPKSYTLSASNYTYDGKFKKPTVTVKDSKGNIISAKNYTVTYTNNKNVGKATVKITFKGNYSGTVSKNFTINPNPTKITSLKAKSKGFKVKWNKVTAQADGYQIQYSTNSSFKSAKTITVKGNKNIVKTVSKLRGKTKYYVRVRAYKKNGKTTYYSAWSKTKSVKTGK